MEINRRRQALRTLALSAGACGAAVLARGDREDSARRAPFPWPYTSLEPADVARKAYGLYDEGHCMYAVFGAVVGMLAERHGEPYASFPLGMMGYGLGGVAGWGALCGALNGAAAAFALFTAGKDRDRVTRHLLRWYEATPLPAFEPEDAQPGSRLPASTAGSVQCHVSSSRWCAVAGTPFFSDERYERCKRLSADTAARCVELLNTWKGGRLQGDEGLSPATTGCLACHTGRAAHGTTFGSMECGTCHRIGDPHPPAP